MNESAISVNVSGTANGIDVAIPDGGGYAINANSSNTNGNATMHVVNTGSSDAIDAVSNGGIGLNVQANPGIAISASSTGSDVIDATAGSENNNVAVNATANGGGPAITATANGGGDALDVTNTTGGNDQTMSVIEHRVVR